MTADEGRAAAQFIICFQIREEMPDEAMFASCAAPGHADGARPRHRGRLGHCGRGWVGTRPSRISSNGGGDGGRAPSILQSGAKDHRDVVTPIANNSSQNSASANAVSVVPAGMRTYCRLSTV